MTELWKFTDLGRGFLEALLEDDCFPEWDTFAPDETIRKEFAESSTTFRKPASVQGLAKRAFYATDDGIFSDLTSVWRTHGATDKEVQQLLEKRQTFLDSWPNTPIRWSDGSTKAVHFSNAYGNLLQETSVFANQHQHVFQQLCVPDAKHTGFPVVQLKPISGFNFNESFWVQPTAQQVSPNPAVGKNWSELQRNIYGQLNLTDNPPSVSNQWSLPDYLHDFIQFAQEKNEAERPDKFVKTLESAGFAIAMQMCADLSNCQLPRTVGFTGRWRDAELHAISGIQEKMKAAKRAGVVLLFACLESDEPLPASLPGLSVVVLPEGMKLSDVIRTVNQVCAESGLTHHRWLQAARKQKTDNTECNLHTPVLSEALSKKRCPVGFVGRQTHINSLNETVKSNQDKRELIALTGPPRIGKSTLLSKFALDFPLHPVWFSFQRGDASAKTVKQMLNNLLEQVENRHVSVPYPEINRKTHEEVAEEEKKLRRLNLLLELTQGPVNFVIDGLDESETPKDVIEVLQKLKGKGGTWVGSQPGAVPNSTACRRIELDPRSEDAKEDANELIDEFAKRLSSKNAKRLREPEYQKRVVSKSGANLWILTEFLTSLEKSPRSLGESPDELRLSSNVKEYCRFVVEEALKEIPKDEEPFVKSVLLHASFLGDRAWTHHDLKKLIEKTEQKAGYWSYNGPLQNATRVIKLEDEFIRFLSPFTREAVRRDFLNDAEKIAKRWVHLIKDSPCESKNDLHKFMVASIASLLSEQSDGGAAIIQDKKIVKKLVKNSGWYEKRLHSFAHRGISAIQLVDELNPLLKIATKKTSKKIKEMIKWTHCWAWAINDNPELASDWVSVLPWKTDQGRNESNIGRKRLLAVGSTSRTQPQEKYTSVSTIHKFGEAACVLSGKSQTLVLIATKQAKLLVYQLQTREVSSETEGQCEGLRFDDNPHSLDLETNYIGSLAASGTLNVFALCRIPDDRFVLSVVNVESGCRRQLENFDSTTVLAQNIGIEDSVVCLSISEKPVLELTKLDSSGNSTWQTKLEHPIFAKSIYEKTDLVQNPERFQAFHLADGKVAILWDQLLLIESTSDDFKLSLVREGVSGILPNDSRLVWTRRDKDACYLEWIDCRSEAQKPNSEIIYQKTSDDRAFEKKYRRLGRNSEDPRLSAKPEGYATEDEVILQCYSQPPTYYTIALCHEPTPEKYTLSPPVEKAMEVTDFDSDRYLVNYLANGDQLRLFEYGATFVHQNFRQTATLESGHWNVRARDDEPKARADGQLVLYRWESSPEGDWYVRDIVVGNDEPLDTKTRVTPDGWELYWKKGSIYARRNTKPHKEFNLDSLTADSDASVVRDVAGCDENRVWVIQCSQGKSRLLRMSLYPKPCCEHKSDWHENLLQNLEIATATKRFVVLKHRDDPRQDPRECTTENWFVYRVCNRTFVESPGTVPQKLLAVSDEFSIGKYCDEQHGFDNAEVWVFDERANQPYRSHSQSTCASFVPTDQNGTLKKRATIACIFRGEPTWTLRFMELHIDSVGKQLIAKEIKRIGLPNEVVNWDYQHGYLALVYKNGRVELRQSQDKFKDPMFIGYLPTAPDYIRVTKWEQKISFATVTVGKPPIWFHQPY